MPSRWASCGSAAAAQRSSITKAARGSPASFSKSSAAFQRQGQRNLLLVVMSAAVVGMGRSSSFFFESAPRTTTMLVHAYSWTPLYYSRPGSVQLSMTSRGVGGGSGDETAARDRHRRALTSSFLGSALVSWNPSSSVAAAAAAASGEGTGHVDSFAKKNPRYLERQVQMTYTQGPGNVNPRSRGFLLKRFTGDSTPYTFPVTPIRLVKEWPRTDGGPPPFDRPDFFRADQLPDGSFYAVPRFVYHIDEPAVAALTQFYRSHIAPGSCLLDICSSWVSHYPLEFPRIMKRISGTGMNAWELAANDQLTDYQTQDLNRTPTLPFEDEAFHVVTCALSIDYLIHPMQVLQEVCRVLKPGGKVIVSQSNRCFPSKAIAMWLSMNDRQHLELINGYFQYAGGFKEPRQAFDITAQGPGAAGFDPMFVVVAEKA